MNEECQGVFIIVTDRVALRPVRVGLEIAAALTRLYPSQYQLEAAGRLFGSRDTLTRVTMGEDPATIAASWAAAESHWRLLRAKYLLYYGFGLRASGFREPMTEARSRLEPGAWSLEPGAWSLEP